METSLSLAPTQIPFGIVIYNESFDAPLLCRAPYILDQVPPYNDQLPPYNSEFLLKPGQHSSGLHAVRVVGPSYDFASGELRYVEVRFDPERYRAEHFSEAKGILEEARFEEVSWEDWYTRTWPWLDTSQG